VTQSARSASAVLTAFGRVLFSAEKVQGNIPFLANDPAIMRHRRNVEKLADFQFDYAPIVKRDRSSSRDYESNVFNWAACCMTVGPACLSLDPTGGHPDLDDIAVLQAELISQIDVRDDLHDPGISSIFCRSRRRP